MGQEWEGRGPGRDLCVCVPLIPVGSSPSSPRPPKPVFQASGVCRSEVLTAQVAKATNIRHMSFWLKVNAARESRGSPRKEKQTLTPAVLCRPIRPRTRLPQETSILAQACPGASPCGDISILGHVCPGTCLLQDTLSESHPPCELCQTHSSVQHSQGASVTHLLVCKIAPKGNVR